MDDSAVASCFAFLLVSVENRVVWSTAAVLIGAQPVPPRVTVEAQVVAADL
jgi:hypothetical protein